MPGHDDGVATMPRARAIEELQKRLTELESLLPTDGEEFSGWFERTRATITHALPQGHPAYNNLTTTNWLSPNVGSATGDRVSFDKAAERVSGVLKAAIYELENLVDDEAGAGSAVLAVHEVKALERLAGEIQRAEDVGELDSMESEQHAELLAELQTLTAQLRSPRPKRSIVRAALASMKNIGEQAVGGAVGAAIVTAIHMAHGLIG